MTQARHLITDTTEMVGIHRGNRCTGLDTSISQDRSPRVDHHRVAMALTTPVMNTRLSGSEHISRVFNRTSLEQNIPVIFPSKSCKCSGNHQQVGPSRY